MRYKKGRFQRGKTFGRLVVGVKGRRNRNLLPLGAFFVLLSWQGKKVIKKEKNKNAFAFFLRSTNSQGVAPNPTRAALLQKRHLDSNQNF